MAGFSAPRSAARGLSMTDRIPADQSFRRSEASRIPVLKGRSRSVARAKMIQ